MAWRCPLSGASIIGTLVIAWSRRAGLVPVRASRSRPAVLRAQRPAAEPPRTCAWPCETASVGREPAPPSVPVYHQPQRSNRGAAKAAARRSVPSGGATSAVRGNSSRTSHASAGARRSGRLQRGTPPAYESRMGAATARTPASHERRISGRRSSRRRLRSFIHDAASVRKRLVHTVWILASFLGGGFESGLRSPNRRHSGGQGRQGSGGDDAAVY